MGSPNNNSLRNYPNTLLKVNNVSEDTATALINKDALSDFLPKGYKISDTIYGDLNKDGLDDSILIIKGTNKEKFVENTFDSVVDRNRRGIIILFNKGNHYEVATKNYDCFSSQNEDGGARTLGLCKK